MSVTCYLQWSWQTTSRPMWGFRIFRSQEGRDLCVYFVVTAILILRTMAHSRHSVNTMLPKRKRSPERWPDLSKIRVVSARARSRKQASWPCSGNACRALGGGGLTTWLFTSICPTTSYLWSPLGERQISYFLSRQQHNKVPENHHIGKE